ncbi:MAG: tetratricopeptide repeat protein [Bacteroidetes bacterium]|nr:tetratricopeptide repeat protein [Bacteroidota bacterium]
MKKLSLLIFLTGFLYSVSFASFDFNTNCKTAYEKIINLRFDEGKKLIENEKTTHPSNLIPLYLDNYIDFLKIFISEDISLFNKLKSNKDIRINKIEDEENESPYYNYCIAEINLQWAFARLKFKEYITAASEINSAYKLLEKNEKAYPKFIPNRKGLGLLHSMIGTIPDDYKWVSKLIGMNGSVNQGINELSSLLLTATIDPEYEYLKTECIFYLSFIELNAQSNKEGALKLSKYLEKPEYSELIQNNPLLCYACSNIALKTFANDKAIKILLARPTDKEYYPFHYLDYQTGIAKLNRLDSDAYKYFYSFILNFKGQNYIKSAYQKLAWYYLINNNTAKYKEKMNNVLTLGSTLVDEDGQALTEAKSNTIPNIILLKARLLCDGGYFQKALNILSEKKPSEFCVSPKDFLEYSYRLGRIYHEWGLSAKAIPFYELTIKNGSSSIYYFAANSALHLGYIYENNGNKEKAKYYYELCSSMKNTEYKNSINQKAKAGLNRLQ